MLKRYAAHYVRVGSWIVSDPLISIHEDGRCTLEVFDHEVPQTIFCNGVVALYHDSYPLDLLASYVVVSMEELADIVEQISGWKIVLPKM